MLRPVAHHTSVSGKQVLLQLLLNLDDSEIRVTKGTIMGHLLDVKVTDKAPKIGKYIIRIK